MKRVRWSHDEISLLAMAVAEARLKDLDSTLIAIVKRQMVEVLPEERRRSFTAMTSVPELRKAIEDEVKDIMSRQSEEIPIVIETPTTVVVGEFLKSVTGPELMSEVVRRAEGFMKTMGMPAAVAEAVQTAPAPRQIIVGPRLPDGRLRIGVIGLLKAQFDQLALQAPTDVQLKFVDKDHKLKLSGAFDWIIVQRHVSHRHTVAAQNAVGRERTVYVNGGIVGCLKAVHDIRSRHSPVAV